MSLERLWAGWRSEYMDGVANVPSDGKPGDGCVMCRLAAANPDEALIVARDDRVFAVLNAYPYTSGHLMVAPLRHVAELDALNPSESKSLMEMTQQATTAIRAAYHPDGQNLGANIGRAGGAGVPGHVHLHVLPRWAGDTNFLTTVAEARVLPEALTQSWAKLRAAWPT